MKTTNLVLTDVSKNSFKFYNMKQISEDQFTAEWGRIGSTPRFTDYDLTEWDGILSSKIKKGYKIVSESK